jgi:uracil-DNA glycosylase
LNASNIKRRLTAQEKRRQLKLLADERKAVPGTDRYENIGAYCKGAHDDHDFVSPVTKSACNVDARIFIMLQDWTSTEDMEAPFDLTSEEHRLGYKLNSKTFAILKRRLSDHFLGTTLADTYATNLFPFIKRGKPNASISSRALVDAAKQYALPQINIVQPILVIALGIYSFWALAKALGQKKPACCLKDAIDHPVQCDGYQVWCQAHTASVRKTKLANAEWANMAKWYWAQP